MNEQKSIEKIKNMALKRPVYKGFILEFSKKVKRFDILTKI